MSNINKKDELRKKNQTQIDQTNNPPKIIFLI